MLDHMENPGAGDAGASEQCSLGRQNTSRNSYSKRRAQAGTSHRTWLLHTLLCAGIRAQGVANEAFGIHDALDRDLITAEIAAWWALQAGIIAAPPRLDYWAQAAVAYRRDRYGANDLLTPREAA